MAREKRSLSGGMKAALEYGPLLLFFVVNGFYGIYFATVVLVLSTVLSLLVLWFRTGTVPKILAFGCGAVVFFGVLTLVFADETFIKVKPTIVSLILASGLIFGRLLGRNPLKAVLGDQMQMRLSEGAWGRLTWLWIVMFMTLAAANEVAWRVLSTDAWVRFKVFGLTGISLFFALVIAVFLAKNQMRDALSDKPQE